MQVASDGRTFRDRMSKHISLYYVDFNHLGTRRVPNRFERELQGRLVQNDVDHLDFKRLLAALKPRDRHMVEAFYMGYTQREIADRFGIAQQTVSRLLRQVGHRLQRMMRGLPWRGEAASLPLSESP